MLWHGLATIKWKTYTTATDSYTENYALFENRLTPAQVGELSALISHFGGKTLKPKIIKGYLAGFCSLCRNCILDMAKLEVYGHFILQKIIAGLWRLYGEGDTRKRSPITWDILLKLISRFDQRNFEGANLHSAFCLSFAEFLRIGESTCDKVESDFRSWHLARGSISLQEDRLLLALTTSKTNPFHEGVTLTISATCDERYAMKSSRNLFEQFPKSHYCPLFSSLAGTFYRGYAVRKL